MVGLTRSLARAAGPDGVTVNAVAPGSIRTPADTRNFPDQAAIDAEQARVKAIPAGGCLRTSRAGRLPRRGRRLLHHRPVARRRRRLAHALADRTRPQGRNAAMLETLDLDEPLAITTRRRADRELERLAQRAARAPDRDRPYSARHDLAWRVSRRRRMAHRRGDACRGVLVGRAAPHSRRPVPALPRRCPGVGRGHRSTSCSRRGLRVPRLRRREAGRRAHRVRRRGARRRAARRRPPRRRRSPRRGLRGMDRRAEAAQHGRHPREGAELSSRTSCRPGAGCWGRHTRRPRDPHRGAPGRGQRRRSALGGGSTSRATSAGRGDGPGARRRRGARDALRRRRLRRPGPWSCAGAPTASSPGPRPRPGSTNCASTWSRTAGSSTG